MNIIDDIVSKRSIIVSKCPICGKSPRIHIDIAGANFARGAYIKIQCKPLFRKPHCSVWSGKALPSAALSTCIEYWEGAVSNIIKGRESGK